MRAFGLASIFAILAAASASVVVAPSANIIQGPSTRTTVVGPDGSSISSAAPGGQIVTVEGAGVVAQTAAVLATQPVILSTYAAPSLVAQSPLLAKSVIAPSAKIIQGPSTRTTVVGPDGSSIISDAPGGQIVTEEGAGVIAHTAPIAAAQPAVVSSYATPSLIAQPAAYGSAALLSNSVYYSRPSQAYSSYAPVLSYSGYVPTLTYSGYAPSPAYSTYAAPLLTPATYPAAPLVSSGVLASKADTVIAGPSGTISTSKSVAAPAIVA